MKVNEAGLRVCDSNNCQELASHTLYWTTEWACFCKAHADWSIQVGDAMGFATPRVTLRPLSPEELQKTEFPPLDALDKYGRVLQINSEVILDKHLYSIDKIIQDNGVALGDDVLRFPRLRLVDSDGHWTECFADEVELR